MRAILDASPTTSAYALVGDVARALRVKRTAARETLRQWAALWTAHDDALARGETPAPPPVPRTALLRLPGVNGRPPYACTRGALRAWLRGELTDAALDAPARTATPRAA